MSDQVERELRVWMCTVAAGVLVGIAGFVMDHNQRTDVNLCAAKRDLSVALGSLDDLATECTRTNYSGLIVLVIGVALLVVGVIGAGLARARQT